MVDHQRCGRFYYVYNRLPSVISQSQKRRFKRALRRKYSLYKAYVCFDDLPLYKAYKIHITCRPTLKRLASLAWLRRRGLAGKCQPAPLDTELPLTLREEATIFGESLWTVDVMSCVTRLFEFVPPLEDEGPIGKQFLMTSKVSGMKLVFKSLTNGWHRALEVDLKLLTLPESHAQAERCVKAIQAEENIGKIIIIFLDVQESESCNRYIVQFQYTHEQYDFTNGGYIQ